MRVIAFDTDGGRAIIAEELSKEHAKDLAGLLEDRVSSGPWTYRVRVEFKVEGED